MLVTVELSPKLASNWYNILITAIWYYCNACLNFSLSKYVRCEFNNTQCFLAVAPNSLKVVVVKLFQKWLIPIAADSLCDADTSVEMSQFLITSSAFSCTPYSNVSAYRIGTYAYLDRLRTYKYKNARIYSCMTSNGLD